MFVSKYAWIGLHYSRMQIRFLGSCARNACQRDRALCIKFVKKERLRNSLPIASISYLGFRQNGRSGVKSLIDDRWREQWQYARGHQANEH